MSKFIINGGKKLKGSVATKSAKNSAVSILCASAMIKGVTTLQDVPRIEEVNRIIEILNSIGIVTKWKGANTLVIDNPGITDLKNINREAVERTRASFMLVGALAVTLKRLSLAKPGGCRLGERTLAPHILGLEHLGIRLKETDGMFSIDASRARAADFTMYEMSDMGAENLILAAVLLPGTTVIRMAGSNYMVQDLCHFLNAAGAKIAGIGTQTLTIKGVKKLKAVKAYPIMPDPIDAMAFISAGVVTGSTLTVTHIPIDFIRVELEKLRVMGQKFTVIKTYRSRNRQFMLADIRFQPSKLTAPLDALKPQPFPGLNIDNLPLFIPILTQAAGTTLVHDWVYENRAQYATILNGLGASITLLDQHRIKVTGPSTFKSARIECPPALRPAMNVLICMLAAPGRSELSNVYSIKRGYEDVADRLRGLGADIEYREE